nr:Ycf62 [Erythrotrichia welwitschii]
MKIEKSITHQKFKSFVESNQIFTGSSSVLAAISGGQDSICLLKLLKDYKEKNNLTVHVIHFNHGWRSDSKDNARFLEKMAKRWGFFFHHKTTTVILSEEKARIWRYSTMQKTCEGLKIQYIATGHTRNDMLETIIFNIVRGSGFEGIQTLQPCVQISNRVSIIHPLLNITREETLWFCRKFFLPVWSDITNYNQEIVRNRIREELVPYFRQYFNLRLEKALSTFIANLNYDLDYLQERTYYLYYKYRHPQYVGINKHAFLTLSSSIKRRLIRTFIYHNASIKLDFFETQNCILLIRSQNIRIKQISSLWYLYISNKWIYLLSSQVKKEVS